MVFAGEAASSKPGTVLGALLFGRRETDRLLVLLQQEGQGQAVPARAASSSNSSSTGAVTVGVVGH